MEPNAKETILNVEGWIKASFAKQELEGMPYYSRPREM
jgi:hypothetical protein